MSAPAETAYHPHPRQGRARTAVAGIFWSSLHTLIPTISAAVVFFVSALFLSPADFGVVGLASGLVLLAVAFSPVAFAEALVQARSVSKAHTDSVFWLSTGFGLLAMIPFLLGGAALADLMDAPGIAPLLPVLALRIPLDLSASVPNALIVRSMRFKMVALRTTVATLVAAVICVAMLLSGFGLWALVASQLATSLVACVLAFRVTGWRPGLSVSLETLRALAHYGIFASGIRMLGTLRLDHIVLGALGGTLMLGLYFFAQRIYMMATQLVSGAFSSVSHALLATLQDDLAKTRQAFGVASFASAAISMPLFVLLGFSIEHLMALALDPKWTDAVFAVQAFSAAGILASIGVVQSALIKSQGRADWWFCYQLAQQGTTVLAIALTWHLGLEIMMIAIVTKSFVLWPVSVAMTAKLLEISLWRYLAEFAHPVLAVLLAGAAILMLPAMAPLPALIATLTLGLIVYVPILVLLSRSRLRSIRLLLMNKGKPAP